MDLPSKETGEAVIRFPDFYTSTLKKQLFLNKGRILSYGKSQV